MAWAETLDGGWINLKRACNIRMVDDPDEHALIVFVDTDACREDAVYRDMYGKFEDPEAQMKAWVKSKERCLRVMQGLIQRAEKDMFLRNDIAPVSDEQGQS